MVAFFIVGTHEKFTLETTKTLVGQVFMCFHVGRFESQYLAEQRLRKRAFLGVREGGLRVSTLHLIGDLSWLLQRKHVDGDGYKT